MHIVLKKSAQLLAIASLLFVAGCQSSDPFGCYQAFESGEYEQAGEVCATAYSETEKLEYASKSAESYSQLGEIKKVKEWVEHLKGSEAEAELWSMLGQLQKQDGEYEQADAAYENSFRLFVAQSEHANASESLYHRGYIAWERAKYKKALEFAASAFDEAQLAQDEKREVRSLYLLSAIFQDLGYYDSADQVLTFIKSRIATDDTASQIYLLINEGTLRMHQQRMALARDSLQESLKLINEGENLRTVRSIYLNLIQASLELGDIEAASHFMDAAWEYIEPEGRVQTPILFYQAQILYAQGNYEKALEMLYSALEREDIAPIWQWQIHDEIGRIAEILEDKKLLKSSYEMAVEKFEVFRAGLLVNELKSAYSNRQEHPFEALFEYYVSSGSVLDALNVTEQARSRTFLDAYVNGLNNSSESRPIATVLDEAPERYTVLSKVLPAMNSSSMVETNNAQDMLASLGARKVLAYYEARNKLWLLAIMNGEVRLKLLHDDLVSLKALITSFSDTPEDSDKARKLFKILLPSEFLPETGSRIYIIPESDMGLLSFAALKRKERYLIEDYIISYVPSANALLAIESHTHHGFGSPLVIGDPLNNLPMAKIEAIEVAGSLNSNAYLGNHASSDVLLESVNPALLHLATHSGLNANGPWFSMADADINSSTILSNQIAPQLVVLASCASASRNNNGLWGSLGAVFLTAGSKAVLASLRTIEDSETKNFISEFYKNDAVRDPAKALAVTQRLMILDNRPVSTWSEFVLLGSNRTFNLGEI